MARPALIPSKKKKQVVRQPKFVEEKYVGPEPEWSGAETWSGEKYYRERIRASRYYNHFYTAKEMAPWVHKWMRDNGFKKEEIAIVKSLEDWRITLSLGSACACLNRGMPPTHAGAKGYMATLPGVPDDLPNAAEFAKAKIMLLVEFGKEKYAAKLKEDAAVVKRDVPQPTIQELLREKAMAMTEEIEEFIDGFDNTKVMLATFKPLELLQKQEAKPNHVSVIRGLYKPVFEELMELINPPAQMSVEQKELHDQLKEGYRRYKKPEIQCMVDMYRDILAACDMISAQGKIERKPRKAKPVSKEKLVATVKYCVSHNETKLVSAKPIDMLGATAALVYNIKTRKLGLFVAQDESGFKFKGTTLIGFDEDKSVQKTLRKPEEQLVVFKKVSRRALQKEWDTINSVATKMNGRFSDQLVIVKVF